MLTKFDTENTKQYQAVCDYWRLGAGRSISQLLLLYKEQENPPSKTYATLKNWSVKFEWDNRISDLIINEQKLLEDMYTEKLIENTTRRFNILDDMYDLTQTMTVDIEDTTLAQATNLYKTLFDAIGKAFNLDAPVKVAPTDPTGQREYQVDTSWENVQKLLDRLALDENN